MNESEPKIEIFVEESELFNVAFDLDVFFSIAETNIKLLKAFHASSEKIKLCDKDVQDLIRENIFLLEQQLFVEVSKIFDASKTNGHENCSFKMLIDLLKKSSKGSYVKTIITEAESLWLFYQNTNLKDIRNKKLAHHDLDTLNGHKESVFTIGQMERLICEGKDINRKVLLTLYGIEYEGQSYDNEYYYNALQKMIVR